MSAYSCLNIFTSQYAEAALAKVDEAIAPIEDTGGRATGATPHVAAPAQAVTRQAGVCSLLRDGDGGALVELTPR
ncbi:hypothetical protein M9979_14860 [Sphingomonas sp. RP10(2022)]|uniref:Uncharacterized protein n=1 Tax=Sphingomonas liriopis TaxID=2949094 RepID=A0A9X2HV93_9SPHN|nr:hypothetical protein [Sphingomonas liriopis]MCP3736154.1 hypothetical protein [Sphingomonas liriopis]